MADTLPGRHHPRRNRAFLVDHLCAQLRAIPPHRLPQTSTSLLLRRTSRYVLRAVAWLPAAVTARSAVDDAHVLRYHVAHDHVFSFLTGGYLGPGYETWIYEYDPATVGRVIGEPVALTFLERTRLDEGKVMLYRAFRDVHHKAHPSQLSVSLNIMIQSRAGAHSDPLAIDVDRGRVTGFFGRALGPAVFLCELAGRLRVRQAVDSLDDLARRHPAWRVRSAALRALAAIDPGAESVLVARGLADPHPQVRLLAERLADSTDATR